MASPTGPAATALKGQEGLAIYVPPQSFLTRLYLGFRMWMFKFFVHFMITGMRYVKANELKKIAPAYTKYYKVRPMLEVRVFVPPKANTPPPLLIDIHGGGFALMDPASDDQFCHYFSHTFNYLVVSINYRKAPLVAFPDLVHDAAELARAVINDIDLSFDHEKIAMGGFSAGGNLTLAIAQLDGIREKVKALVPIYPVCDFTNRYKGTFRPTPSGKPDVLEKSGDLFTWAYIGSEVNRADPLLSVIYATRQQLPQKMYFVGSQYDYLCNEANYMAKKLAGYDGDKLKGTAEPESWNKNGVWWETVRDTQHGFTHMQVKGQEEEQRQKLCNDLYARIAEWLKTEGFRE